MLLSLTAEREGWNLTPFLLDPAKSFSLQHPSSVFIRQADQVLWVGDFGTRRLLFITKTCSLEFALEAANTVLIAHRRWLYNTK